jgi:DNA-binding NarL/FixJ family response regulator
LRTEFSIFVVAANERVQSVFERLLGRHQQLSYAAGAASVIEALKRLDEAPADLIISASPPANVQEVLIWREVRSHVPRLLMLTNYLREREAVFAVLAGAGGLVLAPAERSRALMDSILRVAQGESLIPEGLMTRLRGISAGEAPAQLDSEERRILGLITDGKNDQEIAAIEAVTPSQVSNWIASIAEKLT